MPSTRCGGRTCSRPRIRNCPVHRYRVVSSSRRPSTLTADAPRGSTKRARRRAGVLLLGVLGTIMQIPSVQAQQGTQAMQVEAAFLVNFVRFTQWPPDRFNDNGTPYVIAVVGGDDVAQTVRTVANAAGNIQGRDIAVVRVDPSDVEGGQKRALD